MKNINNELMEYLDLLKKNKKLIIEHLEGPLKNADGFSLRIVKRGKSFQYYFTDSSNKNGIYVPKNQIESVRKIAEKQFYAKVLDEADTQQKLIQKFLCTFKSDLFEKSYDELHAGRKALFKPLWQTKKNFIEKWKAETFESPFSERDLAFTTSFGLKVRSKSELIIAESLYRNKIPFKYEKPLKLMNGRTVYPDFSVLNTSNLKEIYWEHFGMMDDAEYCEKTIRKINAYEQSGYSAEKGNMIFTFETKKCPLNTSTIISKINFLKELI